MLSSMLQTLGNFENPFTYIEDELINIVSKVVVPNNVKMDVSSISEVGSAKHEEFVSKRLINNSINF